MVITKKSLPVDLKELIDSKLSAYDIYRMYIGEFKLNTVMKSPLHRDRHPSFSIGASSIGRLIWRDYSSDEMGGWTDLVGRMYNLQYSEVLKKVAKDFFLLEGVDNHQRIVSAYKQPHIEVKRSLIQVCTQKFTADDLKWWGQFLITAEDLQKEEIYRVKDYYINRQKQILKKDERCYAYYYGDQGFKIYHPDRTREEGKWKSSVPCAHVEGHLNGDAKVLITKSKKDRIVLQKIVNYPVLNVQNEGSSGYTEEFRQKLQGKVVTIMYDNDPAGVTNCKKICDTWNYSYVNVPKPLLLEGIKDSSDWVRKEQSYEPLREFLRLKQIIE